jgi:hypothetical protein
MSLGDFFSKIDQGARKVQMPYLKHLGSMAKDPEQAWRLAMPGDNETTKLTNRIFAREDKPWQGSFSEGLGLPSWYKDEVRARGDSKALGYDHQVKGAVGAVTAAYLGAGAYNAAAGSAAGGGATAGSAAGEGATVSSGSASGTGAASSSPSWMKWMQAGSQVAKLAGGSKQAPAEAPRMQDVSYDTPQYKELLAQYNSNTGQFDDGHTIDIQGQTATLRNSNGQAVGSAPVNQDLFAAVEAMKQKQGVSDGTA